MKCKYCDTELTGRKVYCDDKCRMAFNRQPEQIKANKPEQMEPEQTEPEQSEQVGSYAHYVANPELYIERANPASLNWDEPMSLDELRQNNFKANRVSIPGDWDYE